MTGRDIDYVCVAPTHVASTRQSSDTLIHDGCWAYCYAGVADGHEWRRIAPTPIEELRSDSELPEAVDPA